MKEKGNIVVERKMEIKNEIFAAFAVNGSNPGPTYSSQAICGQIERIFIKNITSPAANGSLWIKESGTDITIWSSKAIASGTSLTVDAYPAVYGVDYLNAAIGSPYSSVKRITNGPVYYAGSGFTSGTDVTFGPIELFYR